MSTSTSSRQRIMWPTDPLVIQLAVESATVIYTGDLVALNGDYVIPISDITDAGEAADNREAGADGCIGIAVGASASGSTAIVPVAIGNGTLIVRLTQQTAAAINVGDNVGPYADATSCSDQLVVEDDNSYIGKCVLAKGSTGTDIDVLLYCSKWMTPQG